MKKLFILIALVLGMNATNIYADVKLEGKTIVTTKSNSNSNDTKTEYTLRHNGKDYPIYISKNGKYYAIVVSKNGKEYKKYLTEEQVKLIIK